MGQRINYDDAVSRTLIGELRRFKELSNYTFFRTGRITWLGNRDFAHSKNVHAKRG